VRLPHRVIIVRRDQPAVFQAIPSGLGRWPTGTSVMWDRRDRIVEWRPPERRAPVESMWHTDGFIVVEMDRLPPEAVRPQPLTSPALAAGRLLPV